MKISSREKKFLLIGGIACALVLGWYALSALLPGSSDLSSTVELKKRMLLKQRETLQQEESFRARLAQYEERLQQTRSRLLPGDNASIASAELQRVLSDLAAQAGVEITQKNIQKEQKLQDELVKIAVRIETNCNPEQLVQFLAAVENYDKHLNLDELVINGFRMQRRFQIRPSMTVSGLIAVPPSAEEDKPAEDK